jgi:Immunoglobulin-like domain of bacterial spore germination/Sporulation and spore germination
MRFLVVPSALAALIVFAACAGGETKTVTVERTVTETGTVPSEAPANVTLFFLRDGKVAPATRSTVVGTDLAAAAMRELLDGPTPNDVGFSTAIPESVEAGSTEVAGDTVIVGLNPEPKDPAARAQIVYTLTALPNVKRVSFGSGTPVGRKAFEKQTPAILVESPVPGEKVEPGFEVTGTANTFEATFNYELVGASGKVLSKNFVTATSGSGTRGTFAFTVPYEAEPQAGTLRVFELSAADGSRINESEIPLQLG